jgi:glycosyltransferase involved in cell wall biosynthesis
LEREPIRKVCLITTNHIATNPRLVKEAMALAAKNYRIHVVLTQHTPKYALEDFRILKQNPSWTYDILDWTRDRFSSRFKRSFSGLLQKASGNLIRFLPLALLHKLILNRHYFAQLRMARSAKADLYIAHNAGALAVAADAAGFSGTGFSFDAEDFHRGEVLKKEVLSALRAIENEYLPQAKYITAASPLIAEAYQKLFPELRIHTVKNVFPLTNGHHNIGPQTGPLKLFWFSQTVGTNRGVQDIIKALKLLEGRDLEFHIYGFLPNAAREQFQSLIRELNFSKDPKIVFFDPISPDELLARAADYEIGFATEPGFCLNNKIALSNKIFTYLAGGNAIIFSNTPAQKAFYDEYRDLGFMYESQDYESLAHTVSRYDQDRELLLRHRRNSKKLFEEVLNWNVEQHVFLNQVERALNGRAGH